MLIFAPLCLSNPDHGGIPEHVMRRGGPHTTLIIITVAMGGGGDFPFYPSRPKRKSNLTLPNECYCCCCHHVGGGGRGHCWNLHPHLPRCALPRYRPSPIPRISANSDIPSAPRALQLIPLPQTCPCPSPWPQPPPKLGSSTTPPLLGFADVLVFLPGASIIPAIVRV